MTDTQTSVKLTWRDNMLFMGKICMGCVRKIGNYFRVNYPCGFNFNVSIGYFFFRSNESFTSESEAHSYLEQFVREQITNG